MVNNSHANQIKLDVDINQLKSSFQNFEKITKRALAQATGEAMRQVALTAASDFMQTAKLDDYETGKTTGGSRDDILNIRTGRLERSLVDNWVFNYDGKSQGGQKEAIRQMSITPTQIKGKIGSSVPYAAIHEYGGIIHHTDLYGKGIHAMIVMPQRPYLRPALSKEEANIQNIFNLKMIEITAKHNAK